MPRRIREKREPVRTPRSLSQPNRDGCCVALAGQEELVPPRCRYPGLTIEAPDRHGPAERQTFAFRAIFAVETVFWCATTRKAHRGPVYPAPHR
jgi:hypothetical protein